MDIVTAKLIPVGSIIERAYWAVPATYDIGDKYPTQQEALTAAIDRRAGERERYTLAGRIWHGDFVPLTIDLRWYVTDPEGGGTDTVVERITYKNLVEAQQALARIKRYTPDV